MLSEAPRREAATFSPAMLWTAFSSTTAPAGVKVLGNSVSSNSKGVEVSSSNNTVGAAQPPARANIISGNTGDGVLIDNGGRSAGRRQLHRHQRRRYRRLGQRHGRRGCQQRQDIGGAGSVISGNFGDGVLIDAGVSAVDVVGNTIRRDATGILAVSQRDKRR